MNSRAKKWIEKLNLIKHPEGGYFRETYRSLESIKQDHLPRRFSGNRVFSTCIYFLLTGDDFSAFHTIRQDEIWHFYDGTASTIHIIDTAGKYYTRILGKDIDKGEELQIIIKAGYIFGASVNSSSAYTLVGCTVAPGFDYDDFKMHSRKELLRKFPAHGEIIAKLTR